MKHDFKTLIREIQW